MTTTPSPTRSAGPADQAPLAAAAHDRCDCGPACDCSAGDCGCGRSAA